MTARFNNAEVRANPDRSITASFEIRNLTGDAWRPSAGFAMGYHIFDPATDTLVVDGPRTPPGADIAPGEACRFEIRCELPAETGRYRVFVSGMQEQSHWLYERGAEFLVLLTAADETFMQTVHARSSYRYDEIVWGARFSDIFAQDRAAHDLTVNISRIHAYERTALP